MSGQESIADATEVTCGGWTSSIARRKRLFKIAATVFLLIYSAGTIFPFYVLFIRTFVSTKEASTLHFWAPPQEEISMDAQIGNLSVFHNLDLRQVKKDLGIAGYVAPRDTLRRDRREEQHTDRRDAALFLEIRRSFRLDHADVRQRILDRACPFTHHRDRQPDRHLLPLHPDRLRAGRPAPALSDDHLQPVPARDGHPAHAHHRAAVCADPAPSESRFPAPMSRAPLAGRFNSCR